MRREDRSYKGSRAGNGGEMVAEEYPLICGHEVPAVLETFGWGGASVVQFQDSDGDEPAVETITDGVDANRRNDQPDRVDRLATCGSNVTQGTGAEASHQEPERLLDQGHRSSRIHFRRRDMRHGNRMAQY